MSHGEAGKGDRTRPFGRKKFSKGYDRVFNPTFFEVIEELDEILDGTNMPIDKDKDGG